MGSLTVREIGVFFTVWLGLLAYVNDKYGIAKKFGHPQRPMGLNQKTIVKLKDKLWEHDGIIDDYIDSVWDMPNEHIQILRSWKKRISGTFLIVRHLKNYSVFLDDENNVLYGVKGISNPISEVVIDSVLPVMVTAVLLPFGNQIIYDSLLYTRNVIFGSSIRMETNELYSRIKKEKGLITQLE